MQLTKLKVDGYPIHSLNTFFQSYTEAEVRCYVQYLAVLHFYQAKETSCLCVCAALIIMAALSCVCKGDRLPCGKGSKDVDVHAIVNLKGYIGTLSKCGCIE